MGTTSTVVATRVEGRPAEIVEVDGQRTMPSIVFVDDDGSLPVGMTAAQLGAGRPDRAVRAPKRRMDVDEPIVVGGRGLSAVELVAALLRHAANEAIRMHGSDPSEVRLTHPVAWPDRALARLREASAAAGLGDARLVPEPIAAAHSLQTTPPVGARVAIYDLGGETFDTVALEVAEEGFVPVSKALGSRAVGGELLDEMIMAHLGERVGPEIVDQLLVSDDPGWTRANSELRSASRAAKESISSHPYAEVAVMTPGGLLSERLTRPDLEQLAAPLVAETIPLLERVIEAAGGVEMIHLVGGGSRLPIVTETIRQRWPGLEIGQTGDPRVAVALGAASISRSEAGRPLVIESERVTPPTPPASHSVAKPPMPAHPVLPVNREPVGTAPHTSAAATAGPTQTPLASPTTPAPVRAPDAEPSPSRLPWLVAAAILVVGFGVAGWMATRIFGDGGNNQAAVDGTSTTTISGATTSESSAIGDDGPTLEPDLRRFVVGWGGFIDYVVSTTDTGDCPIGDLAARSRFEVDPGPTIARLAVESEIVGGGPGNTMLIIERCNREIVSFKTGVEIEEVLDPTTVAPLELDPAPLFLKNARFDVVDDTFSADARFEPGINWRSVEIDVATRTVTDLGPSPARPRVDLYPGGLFLTDSLTLERQQNIPFGSSRSLVVGALTPVFLYEERSIEIPESCAGVFDDVIFWNGLAMGFLGDEMIGWYLMPEYPTRFFSSAGIGLSSHIFEIRDTGAEIESFSVEDRRMIRFNDPAEFTGFDDYVASVSGTSSVDFIHEVYAGVHCEELVFRFR